MKEGDKNSLPENKVCGNEFCLKSLLKGPVWDKISDKARQKIVNESSCALLDASNFILNPENISKNPELITIVVKKCGNTQSLKPLLERLKPYKNNGKFQSLNF